MDTPEGAPAALNVSGELTIFTAATLKQTLLDTIAQATNEEINIDLSEVSEIDTAGIQLMIMAKREAALLGRNLCLVRHSDPVLDMIDLYDLSRFFGDPLLIRSPN